MKKLLSILSLCFAAHLPAAEILFNGNWLGAAWKLDATHAQIKAQAIQYQAAKRVGNLELQVKYSFWPSVRAWAYYNRARFAMDTVDTDKRSFDMMEKDTLGQSLQLCNQGLWELDKVQGEKPLRGEGDYAKELKDRIVVRGRIDKERIFIKRCLGIVPWPKTSH